MAKVVYKEPASYFPKEVRKEFGLGEYAKTEKPKPKDKPKKK